jgi:hypothetical protein
MGCVERLDRRWRGVEGAGRANDSNPALNSVRLILADR